MRATARAGCSRRRGWRRSDAMTSSRAVSSRATSVVAYVVLIALSVGAVLLLWKAVPWIVHEVYGLYNRSGVEFRLGLITAVLSTAGVVWSVLSQRHKETEALRFERKRDVYSDFFDLLFSFVAANEDDIDLSNDLQTRVRFREITKKMMIWASPQTIDAFNKFVSDGAHAATSEGETFKRVETLMRQFRRDLGHNDRRLKKFALTKLVVRGDEHYKFDSM